jgi:hypothetical protein
MFVEIRYKQRINLPTPSHTNVLNRKEVLYEKQISPPEFLAISFHVFKNDELRSVVYESTNGYCH